MNLFLAEAAGTAILILLGDGVVANVLLKKSKGEGEGWIVIATGWGLAVAMAVYAVGRVSGAHINPAVTLGLASIGAFPWADVPLYLAAQMVGAFLGAVLVWLTYFPHWSETPDSDTKLAVFCTAPAIYRPVSNFVTELVGTAVLLFGILAIADNAQMLATPDQLDLSTVFSSGLQPLLVGFLVWSIGLSLGGATGYAINPARDLAPRIAHFLLPIPGKRDSNWRYSWVPVLGPITGGVIGAVLYSWIGF